MPEPAVMNGEMTVTGPDGRMYKFPSGTTPQAMQTYYQRHGIKKLDIPGLISKNATKYGLDPNLLGAQMYSESGDKPKAIGPATSRHRGHAHGLMQLMPGTAKTLGVNPKDILKPEVNAEAGARYMRQMLDRYHGDIRKALAAYNWGPNNVPVDGPMPKLPQATQDYIDTIMSRMQRAQQAQQYSGVPQTDNLSKPSPSRAKLSTPRTMMRGDPPKGLISPGNIDLDNRPQVRNPDGSISTVRSMSFGTEENGKHVEVLVPTVIGNRVVSNEEAIQHYRQTGENLGKFDTPENATAYSQALHMEQAQQYNPQPQTPPTGQQPASTQTPGQPAAPAGQPVKLQGPDKRFYQFPPGTTPDAANQYFQRKGITASPFSGPSGQVPRPVGGAGGGWDGPRNAGEAALISMGLPPRRMPADPSTLNVQHVMESARQGIQELGDMVKGIASSHPEDVKPFLKQQVVDNFRQQAQIADAAWDASQYERVFFHTVGAVPFIGKWAADMYEEGISGDPLGALAKGGIQALVAHAALEPRVGKFATDVTKRAAQAGLKQLPTNAEVAARLQHMSGKLYYKAFPVGLPDRAITPKEALDTVSAAREAKLITDRVKAPAVLEVQRQLAHQRGMNAIADADQAGRTVDVRARLDDAVAAGKQYAAARGDTKGMADIDAWKKMQENVLDPNSPPGRPVFRPRPLGSFSASGIYNLMKVLQDDAGFTSSSPRHLQIAARVFRQGLSDHLESIAQGAGKAFSDESKLIDMREVAKANMHKVLRGTLNSFRSIWGSASALGMYTFLRGVMELGWTEAAVPILAGKAIWNSTLSQTARGAALQWASELFEGRRKPGFSNAGWQPSLPGLPPPRGPSGPGGGGGAPPSGAPPGGPSGGGGIPFISATFETNPPPSAINTPPQVKATDPSVRAALVASKLLPPGSSIGQVLAAAEGVKTAAALEASISEPPPIGPQLPRNVTPEMINHPVVRANLIRAGIIQAKPGEVLAEEEKPVKGGMAWPYSAAKSGTQGEMPGISSLLIHGPSVLASVESRARIMSEEKPVKIPPAREGFDPRLRAGYREPKPLAQRIDPRLLKESGGLPSPGRTPVDEAARTEWMMDVMEQTGTMPIGSERGIIPDTLRYISAMGPAASRAAVEFMQIAGDLKLNQTDRMKGLLETTEFFKAHPELRSEPPKEGL